jgi:replicative DNA helicase
VSNVEHLPIPPHSIEAEQALLGALMIDATAWARIASIVAAEDFFRADHRIIFETIAKLQDSRQAVDVVTVNSYLEKLKRSNQVGGIAYIGTLARDTPTAANVETYAATVRERASLRRLKAIGDEIAMAATDTSEHTAAEQTARAQERLQQLQVRARSGNGLIGARELVDDLVADLDRRLDSPAGLSIGLADFDALSHGLEPGDLVVIGARPSIGKTSVAIAIADAVSRVFPTAVFSAEMPARQLMRRCLALRTQIPQGKLRRPKQLSDDQWSSIAGAAGDMAKQRLWIDDTPSPSLTHIRAETLALRCRNALGLMLVDYVQLVRGNGANRYEQLRDVAYGLKALAKEIHVPIIVLAQLNRGVESREHKRPHVSDLRDSGAIEEAADIIGLLYSEGFYNPDFEMPYVLECSIAKNRNGERGECLWRFDGAYSRVTTLEPGAAAQYRRLQASQHSRKGGNDL